MVTNYRSGHVVDLSATGLAGRRLGDLKDEKWRLVAAKDGDVSFAFQDFSTYGKGVIPTSNVAAYDFSAETNAVWQISLVNFDPLDGKLF